MDIWDQLIAEDATEVDAELLAAYAEGRLDEGQRSEMRGLIGRSPRAMELLDGIRSDLQHAIRRGERTIPFARANAADSRSASKWRSAFAPLLAAAVLLLAVGISFRSGNQSSSEITEMKGQLRELQARLDDRTQHLVSVEQEHAYVLIGQNRPLLHEVRSPALVRMALADASTRGMEDLSPESREMRDDQVSRLLAELVARMGREADTGAGPLLDAAAVFLAANRLDQAKNFAIRAENALGGETAETLNIKAAILIARADEQTGEAAGESFDEAEELLLRAVALSADFSPAWFNLALLHEERQDLRAAAEAWRSYLEHEEDIELRDIVRQQRGIE